MAERAEAEIVDDEQAGRGVAGELAVEGAVGPGGAQRGEHLVRGDVEDGMSGKAGAVANGLSEVALTHAGRTDQENVGVVVEESAGGHVENLGLGERGVEAEVEVIQGLQAVEGGAAEAELELLAFAPLHLVDKQPVEELDVADVTVSGLAEPEIQALQNAGEPELFQHGDKVVSGVQARSPWWLPRTRRQAVQTVALSEGRRPLVYFLGKRGLALAADVRGVSESAIDWKKEHNDVRWPFLEHLLATNEIRVRLEVAAPAAGFTVLEWRDDKTLASQSIRDQFTVVRPGGTFEAAIGPDGYVSLLDPNGTTRHRAFIEADRGTVPLGRWQEKVERYVWYFRSPAFAERYGASKPFRVLTVTTSAERLANMKGVAEEAGGQTWFWFSTYEALADPADMLHRPSWLMAGYAERVAFPYPRGYP